VAIPLVLKARPTLSFSATTAGAASRDKLITVRNPTRGTATLGTCAIPPDFAIGLSTGAQTRRWDRTRTANWPCTARRPQ
jgi:hypothetical protein